MAKGDIVLISFPFTNLKGSKLRPAVVLIETTEDLTVCFITTQIEWKEETDLFLQPSGTNGLKRESIVRTAKIATIDRLLSKGLLGRLDQAEMDDLNHKLKIILNIG
ncbi:MAG TPA: type II toxin-antitoxin system PemK/MazF family toxin [Agriterribacter sp.]|nr:type II toxin-antitoxin system PemK/MazF family toxin [Agriterribacter sp.]HRQ49082.1 type II toxin-antitoxin system PemK/MazF family toxin [Agriterribacter sp.]